MTTPTLPTGPAPAAQHGSTTLIVGDDDDTLIRLQNYLRRAGVPTRATRRLDEAWSSAAECAAIVLMPDDFDTREVADGLCRVLSRSPSPFVIVVTALRQHLEPLLETFLHPASVVIIPKPVWGWTILDLLRGPRPSEA